jgi:predicted DNA-binding transcriptional regulator AlpA
VLLASAAMARSPDLVGLGEIADLYGVEKNSAWRWSRRADFPAPAVRISGRIPAWRRADVERWARANLPLRGGRPPNAAPGS